MRYLLTIWNEMSPGEATEEKFPSLLEALQRVGTIKNDTTWGSDRRLTLQLPGGRWMEWMYNAGRTSWQFQEGDVR